MKKQLLLYLIVTALTGCNTTTSADTTRANTAKPVKQSMTTIILEENCKNNEYILVKSEYLFGGSTILTKYGCKHNTKLTKHVFVGGKMKEIQAPSRDGKTYTKKELNELVVSDPNVSFGKVISKTKMIIEQ